MHARKSLSSRHVRKSKSIPALQTFIGQMHYDFKGIVVSHTFNTSQQAIHVQAAPYERHMID